MTDAELLGLKYFADRKREEIFFPLPLTKYINKCIAVLIEITYRK